MAAKQLAGIQELKELLVSKVKEDKVSTDQTIVTNSRHYEGLMRTEDALFKVLTAIKENVTGDFLAQDIRESLHHLGEITGEGHNR